MPSSSRWRYRLLGRTLVEGHALDRLGDLVDAQEALLLTAGQESLDLLQLDHLTHRHVAHLRLDAIGARGTIHVPPPPGVLTNVRSIGYCFTS